jgi:RES domain
VLISKGNIEPDRSAEVINPLVLAHVNDLEILPIRTIEQDTNFFRVHWQANDALYFNNKKNKEEQLRFNDPTGRYGVLYAAKDSYTAFRESFGGLTFRRIGRDILEAKCLTVLKPTRNLNLVDLSSYGLSRIGSDAKEMTSTANNYSLCKSWSKLLHDRDVRVDGLYYRSRYDPSRFCLALFDRVKDSIEKDASRENISFDNISQPTIQEIMDLYQYRFSPD